MVAHAPELCTGTEALRCTGVLNPVLPRGRVLSPLGVEAPSPPGVRAVSGPKPSTMSSSSEPPGAPSSPRAGGRLAGVDIYSATCLRWLKCNCVRRKHRARRKKHRGEVPGARARTRQRCRGARLPGAALRGPRAGQVGLGKKNGPVRLLFLADTGTLSAPCSWPRALVATTDGKMSAAGRWFYSAMQVRSSHVVSL